MQSVLKPSNRTMFRSKRNLLGCLYRHMMQNNGNIQQCLNRGQVFRLLGSLPHNTIRQIQREYKAVHSILIRSGLPESFNINRENYCRYFSTSSTRSNKENPNASNNSSSDQNKDQNKDQDKKNSNEKNVFFMKVLIASLLNGLTFIWMVSYMTRQQGQQQPGVTPFVSWNEFVHQMLAKGEVEKVIVKPEFDLVTIVLHDGAVFKGRRSPFRLYFMQMPDITKLEEKLREAEDYLHIKPEYRVPIIYERTNATIGSLVAILIAAIVLFATLSAFAGMTNKFSAKFLSGISRAKFTLVDPLMGVGKGVKFTDVAGLQEAKTEIMEFVDYLKSPDRYKNLGAKIPKGALLLGPPGCGKTLLAKAVATEANVPFLSMNGSEFIEMLGGLGAARVRDLFREAKKRSPSIIYIDEIDAIGTKRSTSSAQGADSEQEQTLNQLLTEMDGMKTNQEVIVLASTNRAEVLDKALLRPGRFDRHILIDLPTLIERKEIFEYHLKGISLEHKPSTYSRRLAFLTPGFSGADIANVCNESALRAARLSKKTVDADDLLYAVDRVIAGIEKRDKTIAPSEKRVVAYHEAGHALVAWLLEHTDALLKVTIVPRTNRVLGYTSYSPADLKLYTQEQLFERMCVWLGGRVAESLTFNRITDGAANDLEKVTKSAYAQIQQFGMNETIGPISFDPEMTDTRTRKPYSRKLANMMDYEARALVTKAYLRTEQLLKENKDKLKLVAEALLKKETLSYEEVEKLIGPPPFGKKNLIEPADFEMEAPVVPTPETPEQESPPSQRSTA